MILFITTVADLVKDRRFVALQSLIKEETCPVIRGKFGATQSVSVWDLVVGDVILLQAGARVPADCLVVEAADLEAEDAAPRSSSMSARRSRKTAAGADGAAASGDPFLLAESLLTRGKCKAVVCRVGPSSSRGALAEKMETDIDTKLQRKLANLASHLRRDSCYAAGAIFLLMTVMLILQVAAFDKEARAAAGLPSTASVVISRLASQLNFAVVLLVVSIPDGLPLAIGVSLAFSVMKMYGDKLLVTQLDAPEKMGAVEEICCGKTGTITGGDMRVAQFHCEAREVKNTRKNTLFHCELAPETLARVKDSILYNCEARVEMDATTYVPVGNATEVALLRFLQDAEVPVHLLIQKKLGKIRATCPFSPESKRSAVALECPDRPGEVFVYVKGAPEVVVGLCDRQLARDGLAELGSEDRATILEAVSRMAAQPLRVMAFAYTSMDLDTWVEQYEGQDSAPERAMEDALLNSQLPLTYIGAFGLRDSLRPRVPSCVTYARDHARLAVRLVSGDHLETAKAVAFKAGILRPEEAGRMYAVMHAEQFREVVGGLVQRTNEETGESTTEVENLDAFREVAQNLKVLARATAADKHLLVVGLKGLNRQVAATGDGINDVEALKAADVGVAMGSGVAAAKEAASIILVGDDFEAALKAVMWGRNIYHNITRFIQFQLTVNVSALLTVAFGVVLFGIQPMNSVQLLWINLVMDTFAALALASEPPLPSVIEGPPFGEKVSILSPTVWRQILGVSAWNTALMVFLMVFGRMIGGLDDYDRSTSTLVSMPAGYADRTDAPTSDDLLYRASHAKVTHLTYIFNTFVILQIFNLINCRKIGRRDFNVFESFFHNWFFLIIFAGTLAMQYLLVNVFSGLTRTVPLGKSEWGACMAVGTTPILISALLKLTPERWVSKIPLGNILDEDTVAGPTMMDKYTVKA